jgi:hypothetical protein
LPDADDHPSSHRSSANTPSAIQGCTMGRAIESSHRWLVQTPCRSTNGGLERGVTIERFHAEWHNAGVYNPAAGPIRNRTMAQAKPKADLWLAFWDGKFKQRGQRKVSGTFDGITAALEAGIEVTIKPPRRA